LRLHATMVCEQALERAPKDSLLRAQVLQPLIASLGGQIKRLVE
jgi:hypothetical protein